MEGGNFCRAFSDLLINEVIESWVFCNSSVFKLFKLTILCWRSKENELSGPGASARVRLSERLGRALTLVGAGNELPNEGKERMNEA